MNLVKGFRKLGFTSLLNAVWFILHLQRAFATNESFPAQWVKLATKENKGKDPKSLIWDSPEGIRVKPLYTKTDWTPKEEYAPGTYPYTRGPYATMYRVRPWTIRQYAGLTMQTALKTLKITSIV